jgi:DNA-binding transcriptional ArsR family regulator
MIRTAYADPLSGTFAALADPTRRAILASLTTGSKTVTELAEPFDMTLPAISKHLKVLEKAKLIERSRQAQYRPCTLHSEPLQEVDRWLDQYRAFFEESFDRLEEYLRAIQARGGTDAER